MDENVWLWLHGKATDLEADGGDLKSVFSFTIEMLWDKNRPKITVSVFDVLGIRFKTFQDLHYVYIFYVNEGTGVFAFYKHVISAMDDSNFLFAEHRASALQTCAANTAAIQMFSFLPCLSID